MCFRSFFFRHYRERVLSARNARYPETPIRACFDDCHRAQSRSPIAISALVFLGKVGDVQVCDGCQRIYVSGRASHRGRMRTKIMGARTGRQALLQLLGLVGVLEHQGVEMALAADLELDIVCLLVLLDPRSCIFVVRIVLADSRCRIPWCARKGAVPSQHVQEASLRRQISMNWSVKPVSTVLAGNELTAGRMRTFLISATSLGILAVIEWLCYRGS